MIKIGSSLVFLSLILPLGTLAATHCDDINDAADGWNEMSDGVHEFDARALSDSDAEAIDQQITEARDLTHGFALELSQSNDNDEAELGRYLIRDLEEVVKAVGLDDLVDSMDTVVDTLDEIVDLCDEIAEDSDYSSSEAYPTVQIYFVEPTDASYKEVRNILRNDPIFTRLAKDISDYIALPHDLPIYFQTCGEVNAFYDPNERRIGMCYELFAQFAAALLEMDTPKEDIPLAVAEVGAFTMLHEIGHALVDILDLPITGREEDSVDALATVLLLDSDEIDAVLSSIDTFDQMARWNQQSDEPLAVWDVHSLNSQRFYDMLCLAYGSDPEQFQYLLGEGNLPEERASQCPGEWQQKATSWARILAPHLR